MKPSKIIRNITFILAVVYCFGAGVNIYDHQKDVQAKTVIKTIELGYVNTDHAISTGTKRFLDKNLARTLQRNDTISYAQYWGNPMLGEHFIQIEKKFVVKRNLNEADKESALFLIYKDVSEAFEKFQLTISPPSFLYWRLKINLAEK